jgi:hypothetical protein
MHHNLAIKSLKYYDKVQTHNITHTNVLKSTKIKLQLITWLLSKANRHRSDRCNTDSSPDSTDL